MPRPASSSRDFGGRRTGAGLSVKIEGRSREPFGVLVVQSMAPRSFAAGDVDFLQALANVLADALERQAIEDAIRERAVHDPLTGLPNRVLFVDRLEHALARLGRQDSLAAILFLDLDHFKLVNDSLGHHVGDELLTAAAPAPASRRCARATPWPGSAATSSASCSRTSRPSTTRSRRPSGSRRSSRGRSCCRAPSTS